MKRNSPPIKILFANIIPFGIFAAVICVVGCSPESPVGRQPTPPLHIQNETELTKIVADYVWHTRGWPDHSYTLELNSRDNNMLVFWVRFKGDNPLRVGGGGKSFEVLLNPDTKHVERELRFQ